MVRVIVPDPLSAERLVEIARVAFEGRESHWSADDFVALGDPPHAAMIVDDGVILVGYCDNHHRCCWILKIQACHLAHAMA